MGETAKVLPIPLLLIIQSKIQLLAGLEKKMIMRIQKAKIQR